MGGEGKGRPEYRPDHLERRQGPADPDGRGPGESRPRHHGPAHLVRRRAGRQFRAGRRHRQPADRRSTARSRSGANIAARSTATGWRCRPLWQQLAAALRPHRLCSRNMPGSTCRRCTRARMRQPDKELVDNWTWDNFLTAAEKCSKAGHPFGLGLSTCTDAINVAGSVLPPTAPRWSMRRATSRSSRDATRQVLDWFKRLSKTMPDSVYAYDNASNNKELISGQGGPDHEPAERLCGRRCATSRRSPSSCGPFRRRRDRRAGSTRPAIISGASGISRRTSRRRRACWPTWRPREIQEKLVAASSGFDIPPFDSLMDFKVWEEVEPPKYTIYNFPPRGDVIPSSDRLSGAA